jgi:tetratricopeptide (TPR) repeat protein
MNNRSRTELRQIAHCAMLLVSLGLAWGQKAPAKKQSPLAVAQARLDHGDLQAAENTIWPLLNANPNHKEALTLLGVIRGRQHRYPEAESLFRRVLKLDSGSAVAYQNLGSALVAQDKMDEAIQQYKDGIKAFPANVDLKVDLARLYAGNGHFADVLSILGTIPAAQFPIEAVPVKAGSLLALGRQTEALKLVPQAERSPAAAVDLAEVLLQSKLPDEALKLLDAVSSRAERLPGRYYYLKGKALQQKGQSELALSNFHQALALDPKSGEILMAAAEVLALQNKHADSLALLQRAEKLSPGEVSVLRPLIIEAERAGQHRAALDAAHQLLQKAGDNSNDLYLAAAAMLQEQDQAGAAAALEKYTAQNATDPKGWLGLGMAYLAQRRYPDARKALEQSAQLNPSAADTQYQFGMLAIKESKTEEAIQHFERAVQLQPQPQALVELGTLYLQAGDLEKAQDALQKSAALVPNEAEIEYKLGLVLGKLGKADEARLHMHRAQQLREQSRAQHIPVPSGDEPR